MIDYANQVRTLLGTAEQMPYSTARLAVLEEAVRVADTHQDVGLGIAARRPFMMVARELIRGDILTAAFAWCLALYDREPQRFGGHNLLFEYRWVIGQLANLDNVTRAKLEELLGDFGRRLVAAGCSPRNLYLAQMQIAPDLGDRALAAAAVHTLPQHPRDALSYSPGWELAEEVEAELFAGDEPKALRRARPFLTDRIPERGKTDEVCARLLLPLLKRGRGTEAAALHARCFRTYRPERCYYWRYGEQLKFSALTNDVGRAVRIYTECQHAIKDFTDPLTRLHFALDAVVLFDRLAAAGTVEIALRLPKSVPVVPDGERYAVAGLREWLGREARKLAERFDARNGNAHFREQIAERAELQQLATNGV